MPKGYDYEEDRIMSERECIKRLVLGLGTSTVVTIGVLSLTSKIINYAGWAKLLAGGVYFWSFCAIIADAGHIFKKDALQYNEYHKVSLKWELSFIVTFFFMTLIISDILIQKYDNVFAYSIVFVLAVMHTVYFINKLKTTI